MTPAPDSDPFCGIGIVGARKAGNLGALARSGHAFGAALVFAIGFEPSRMDASVDTTKASRHLSLAEYSTLAELIALGPEDCALVGVECGVEAATSLPSFVHPRRALYLLGSEGSGLGAETLAACHHVVEIPSRYPLNVATAGSIVLYDRVAKGGDLLVNGPPPDTTSF